MDLNALRTFVAVARCGSFAAVAREDRVDPSSVSRIVALLEAELQVRLFQRTTRHLSLTDAGQLYLTRIEGIVDEIDAALDAARAVDARPAGLLRLTCSVAFGQAKIVPLLGAFRAAFPALAIDLQMTDLNLDLIADRIDLAVRLGPSVEADVVGTKLFGTRYRVCASPAYLAGAPPLWLPDDLAHHRCVLFTLPAFRSRWRFRDAAGVVTEVAVQGDVLASSALAVHDGAIAGLGPALVPDWLVDDDIAQGRLTDAFPHHQATATTFDTAAWLLYPSRAFLPHKVRVTIDFLRAHLRTK